MSRAKEYLNTLSNQDIDYEEALKAIDMERKEILELIREMDPLPGSAYDLNKNTLIAKIEKLT